ncbi:hypothetical protein IEQ34_018400 [Dendrobium chrysotoxum]|uniref:Uncharacterized protein n=1 Tax=Dendrobium chrysotoxum TaxID=161865 RepID=A0AAV7GC96_DENCH|nr:hypothetical protein IEQ34_018400 [Dendrobium chrysotoxum]
MLLGRITPPSCIVWKGIIWWAEIGCSDHNGTRKAPLPIINTHNLITRPTAQPIVEKSSAKSCSVCPISLTVQIPIPTSSTYTNSKVRIEETYSHFDIIV